jgi:dihydrofolate reductase
MLLRRGKSPESWFQRTGPFPRALVSFTAPKLKQRYERDIVVHGSPQLARTLIEHDLVDALHLQVYPVIVGTGKRLFSDTSQTKRLRLTEAKTVGDGVHILIYEQAA